MKISKIKSTVSTLTDIVQTAISRGKKNENMIIRTKYARLLNKRKIDSHVVLYESYNGRGMVCNPYAIFQQLLTNGDDLKLTHVWSIDDFEDNKYLIEQYKHHKNVIFVKRESTAYLKYLINAKYLISNVTFPNYLVKAPEQVYINTWHGIPLKHLGYDIPGSNLAISNTLKNLLSADYITSANPFLTDIYLNSYKLKNLYEGSIIEEGYPRNDLLLRPNKDKIFNLFGKYGITVDPNKEIILYAPTWRGAKYSSPTLDIDSYIEFKQYLESKIDTQKYQILIKPHQIVYENVKNDPKYKGLLIPAGIDTDEILALVDILISDYSSIFFDFMVLKKPILFYIPDLEHYKNERGLYFTPDQLPGPTTVAAADVANWINNIDQTFADCQEKFDTVHQWACPYEDGHVTARIIDTVFRHKQECRTVQANSTHKKKILFLKGAMLENGITHSFMSLLNQLDYDQYDVTTLVNASSIPEIQKKILAINKEVRVLTYVSTHLSTPYEEIKKSIVFQTGFGKKLYDRIFPHHIVKNEFTRCFGQTSYDYAIDFAGYNPFPALLCLQAKDAKTSIWLHNDIYADQRRCINGKYPLYVQLKSTISLYPKFDNLVSCSHSVMTVNKKNLAVPATKDKFTYAKNTVNTKRIHEQLDAAMILPFSNEQFFVADERIISNQPRDLQMIKLPDPNVINFVTMGRMSTEKNQQHLITAFALFTKQYPTAKLYLIGDGPLRENLKSTIRKHALQDNVILTGLLPNPFTLMKQCSCFILPSLYEGQPMVLLEARVLGLPLIIANFSSVADSLLPDGQLLVESDVTSIYDGMIAYAHGHVPQCTFDVDDYNQEALSEFESAIH